MEVALRHLPGVIYTESRYAKTTTRIGDDDENVGATTTKTTSRKTGISPPSPPPSYETVCGVETGNTNTVRVMLDREALNPSNLFDCLLSLHDPTKGISHVKKTAVTGQYRSCVFVPTSRGKEGAAVATADCKIIAAAREAVEEC